jgi:dTDP-4-dehydrorhamnose 3,5-epimerase
LSQSPLQVEQTPIDGLLVLRAKTVTDARGAVREFFRASAFTEAGVKVPDRWAQVNLTRTECGAVRGLHGEDMTKLVGVAAGTAHGAYVDTRRDSPSYAAVVELDLVVGTQVLVPPGVCNGLQATSAQGCEYLYCFDVEWAPDLPGVAVNPLDPALGISWPLPPVLSDKDRAAPLLAEIER